MALRHFFQLAAGLLGLAAPMAHAQTPAKVLHVVPLGMPCDPEGEKLRQAVLAARGWKNISGVLDGYVIIYWNIENS